MEKNHPPVIFWNTAEEWIHICGKEKRKIIKDQFNLMLQGYLLFKLNINPTYINVPLIDGGPGKVHFQINIDKNLKLIHF